MVGVNKGVCSGGGSELRRTERSVALLVRGLGTEGRVSDEVGEGTGRGNEEEGSTFILEGRGRD